MSTPHYPNTLHQEFLGFHSITPLGANHNSASRGTMASSHFSQKLTLNKGDSKLIQTGLEHELAQTTFSVKIPVDAKIIAVIDRYPTGVAQDAIPENPEKVIVYEDINDRSIGCVSIPGYVSHHQYFGYELKPTQAMSQLATGVDIPKDTILMDSPAVSENNDYQYGRNLNIALMSHPGVSEDGIVISEAALDKLTFKVYDRRVIEFGKDSFPLNIYGTSDHYKPFPEIGEYVHESSALMIMREFDSSLVPVQMSAYDLMEPDFIFDTPIYVRGPKGKVVDIKVYHQDNPTPPTPTGMTDLADKYSRALTKFYTQVRELEKKLRYNHRNRYGTDTLVLKPEFHSLVKDAIVYLDWIQAGRRSQAINMTHRKNPLDDYRIEFVVEYEVRPTIGSKLSDAHGAKGVICSIMKTEDMPVDADGNIADLIMDGGSILSRMNLGRLYEQYIQGVIRDVTKRIRTKLNITGHTEYKVTKALRDLQQKQPQLIQECHEYAMSLYETISQPHYQSYLNLTQDEIIEHLAGIVLEGIIVWYPTDNQKETPQIVADLETRFKPTYTPVTYRDATGKLVTTKTPVRIAPVYCILLEKTADVFAAVSSGRLQHFGVLSPINKMEKHTKPWHNSPVRTIGETEARIIVGYGGREAIAELMDRNNNPSTHRYIVKRILQSQTPSNIQEAIDRNLIPLGAAKPLQILKHFTTCSGWVPVYEPAD